MSYSLALASRPTLTYGYGSSVTTVPSPQTQKPFQPVNTFINTGATDLKNQSLSLVSATLQGYGFSQAVKHIFKTVLHLDIVMDMNTQGSVNSNDYATYYAVTSLRDYRLDVSAFEVTSTFYDGNNKNLLTVTDSTTFTMLDENETLGFMFHSAALISNDMVVPYSRLYGWSGIRR